MSERDKLIAQAEALEALVAEIDAAQSQINGASIIASCVADQAEKLRALAAQQPVEEPVAWMIEITSAPTPLWFSGENTEEGDSIRPRFSRDANEGVRFSRKQDAESCLKFLLRARRTMLDVSNYAVTEHMWHNPQASAPVDLSIDPATVDFMEKHLIDPDAPADHTAADAPNREAGSSAATHGPSQVGNSSAVGVTPDLDALVADDDFTLNHADDEVHSLRKFFGDNDATAKLFEDAIAIYKKRIIDLLALSVTHIMLDVVPGFDGCGEEIYAKSVKEVEQCMSKMGIQIDEQTARITRLEAENAEARELLDEALDKFSRILDARGPDGCSMSVLREFVNRAKAAFLAKGATP